MVEGGGGSGNGATVVIVVVVVILILVLVFGTVCIWRRRETQGNISRALKAHASIRRRTGTDTTFMVPCVRESAIGWCRTKDTGLVCCR